MAPNKKSHYNIIVSSTQDSNESAKGKFIDASLLGKGPEGQPASTYEGIWRYPTNRDAHFRTAENWMECKKKDDDIGDLWRVHDKLYNLTDFIMVHPGGSEWIRVSQGTDITEAFMSSHVVNIKTVESILEHYYVKPATYPRISPYTFKEDGFYMTLKRRVEPIFRKAGTGPTFRILLMQDTLVAVYIILALLASALNSIKLAVLSGIFLCFQTIGAHNFAHLRDNWRSYYFDLSLGSSYEWRITHSFSHHMYPNTLLDMQLSFYPTFQFLPNRQKHWSQRQFSICYSHFTYAIGLWIDLFKRYTHIFQGKKQLRVENLLPFLELLILMCVAEELTTGLLVWIVTHTVCSYLLLTIGAAAGHHHTTCFIDGDEPQQDTDFGICQLDATKDRAEDIFDHSFVALITFGHHQVHHLFPAVCHSKLHYAKEIFLQTCRDFNVNFPGVSQKELYFATYKELARTTPTIPEERALVKRQM